MKIHGLIFRYNYANEMWSKLSVFGSSKSEPKNQWKSLNCGKRINYVEVIRRKPDIKWLSVEGNKANTTHTAFNICIQNPGHCGERKQQCF